MAPDEKSKRSMGELAAELARLSPAERHERLIEIPTDHLFKVIGTADQPFADAVRAAVERLGHASPRLELRYSSNARYLSITLTVRVESGAKLVELYEALGTLEGLRYLL